MHGGNEYEEIKIRSARGLTWGQCLSLNAYTALGESTACGENAAFPT